ncbi:MAG: HAD family phosphatase [Eubacteriales bacterium]|nr:HAD family phosphatase [Eubacteriales bacterium]
MDIRLLHKGHIIFDIGNVLLRFDPEKALEAFAPKDMQQAFLKHVVQSPEWQELDRGTLTYEQAAKSVCRHEALKGEEQNVLNFLYNFPKLKNELPAIKAVSTLKQMGKKLYVLSNYHDPAFRYVYAKYPFFKLFDGLCISCYHKLLKPEKAFYELLIKQNNIPVEDAVFIDDMQVNVQAAEELGITGIHYKGDIDFE